MIVIGGGSAGLTAAGMSSLLGAKTALIERHRLGGDCTWTGCIPSKSLIHASRVQASDFPSVMERVRAIRQRVYEESDAPPNMERLGVEVIPDEARFIDPHTIELASGRRLTSRYFVIATGSRPRTLNAPVPVYTNETIFELNALPARLAIAGAGPVGIELAQAFRRLGSNVTVIGSSSSILPRDDAELTAILQPELAIPHHYAFTKGFLGDRLITSSDKNPLRYQDASRDLAPETSVRIVEPGIRVEL